MGPFWGTLNIENLAYCILQMLPSWVQTVWGLLGPFQACWASGSLLNLSGDLALGVSLGGFRCRVEGAGCCLSTVVVKAPV